MEIKKKDMPIIAVGLLLVLAYIFIAKPDLPVFSLFGGDTLVLQKSEYISNDTFFSGDTFHMVFAATGSGGSYQVTLTPSEIAKLDASHITTKNTVSVTITKDESCRYAAMSTNKINVYTIDTKSTSCSLPTASGGGTCTSDCRDVLSSFQKSQSYIGWSFYTAQTGSAGCGNYGYQVRGVHNNAQGIAYEFDPTPISSVNLNITVDYGNGITKTIFLNDKQLSNEISGELRAKLLGSLGGSLQCPDASGQIVAYVPVGSNSVQAKDKFLYNQLKGQQLSLSSSDASYAQSASVGAMVNNFVASSPGLSALCPLQNFSSSSAIDQTYASCKPISPVSIPLLDIYIKAQDVGVVIPVGNFTINNVTVSNIEAATLSKIAVSVTNTGDDASVDARVKCPNNVNPFSVRDFLKSGETKTLLVPVEYAGVIQNCLVTVNDVNSPSVVAVEQVKLNIAPYCTKLAPSSNHVQLNSEIGCQFICPNEYDKDINEINCAPITSYDRCILKNDSDNTCIQRASYGGFHCTNVGHYANLNNYLDAVNEGTIQPFIPQYKEHQIFLSTPICNYVAEYGYKIQNGVAVPISGDYTFDAATAFTIEAQQQQIALKQGGFSSISEVPKQLIIQNNTQTIIIQNNTETVVKEVQLQPQQIGLTEAEVKAYIEKYYPQQQIQAPQDNTLIYAAIGIVAIAVIYVWYKRR